MLRKLDVQGNPYLGVFCASNDEVLVVPPGLTRQVVRDMEAALGAKAMTATVGGSTVVGSLLVLNTHGGVVTGLVTHQELETLRGLNLAALDHRLNATGNTILANDKGALIHPGYDRPAVELIADALDVEVVKGSIAGSRTVGSVAVANNKGAICHPHARPEELELLRGVLKVDVEIATANYGTPQVGACIVANDKGALVGTPTTPIEIGRIEEGLHLY